MSEFICGCSVSQVSANALVTDATGCLVAWLPTSLLNTKPHKKLRRHTAVSAVTDLKIMKKKQSHAEVDRHDSPLYCSYIWCRLNKWKSCFANEQAVRDE